LIVNTSATDWKDLGYGLGPSQRIPAPNPSTRGLTRVKGPHMVVKGPPGSERAPCR